MKIPITKELSYQKIEDALQEIVMSCLETSRKTFNNLIIAAKLQPDKFKKISMNFSMDEKTLNDLKHIVGRLESKRGKSVKDYLQLRHLKKMIIEKELSLVFCPLVEGFTENLMSCMFCSFGHRLECHFPYDCSSEYCDHYRSQREWEREQGVPENNSDGLYHFKLMIFNFMEAQKKNGVKSAFNDKKNTRG